MNRIAPSDFIRLHVIVILFGFTGILGKLVSIPAVEMVFYRTLFAALGLGVLLLILKRNAKIGQADLTRMLLTGLLVGGHWLTFFISARISNVSVSLVGFATASFWTAFLEPLAMRSKIKTLEVILALLVFVGLSVIFSFDFRYSTGLAVGIASGLLCAVFTIINAKIVKRVEPFVITFYEMVGACVAIGIFLPFYANLWADGNQLRMGLTATDALWILLLAWLCTVFAYSTAVELMKRITVFLFQLTLNLEPVYGIIMAIAVFGESEKMDFHFYVGTFLVLCTVILYPALKAKFTGDPSSTPNP